MLVERLLPGVRSRMKRAARAIPAHDFGPGRGLRVGRSGRRSWLMRFKSNTLAECNGRLNVYCWGIMWQSGRVANCLFAGFRARRGRRCPDGTSIRYQPDRRGGLLEPFRLRWTHSAEADLVRDQVDRRRAWRCHGQDGTRRDRGKSARPIFVSIIRARTSSGFANGGHPVRRTACPQHRCAPRRSPAGRLTVCEQN